MMEGSYSLMLSGSFFLDAQGAFSYSLSHKKQGLIKFICNFSISSNVHNRINALVELK